MSRSRVRWRGNHSCLRSDEGAVLGEVCGRPLAGSPAPCAPPIAGRLRGEADLVEIREAREVFTGHRITRYRRSDRAPRPEGCITFTHHSGGAPCPTSRSPIWSIIPIAVRWPRCPTCSSTTQPPNPVDYIPSTVAAGKFWPTITPAWGIAYNTELVNIPPKTWRGLYDGSHRPGEIGMVIAGSGGSTFGRIMFERMVRGEDYWASQAARISLAMPLCGSRGRWNGTKSMATGSNGRVSGRAGMFRPIPQRRQPLRQGPSERTMG